MQHTAPPLKTRHFPSPPHLHLGPGPKHVLITLMSQTRTSGHAVTTPYSLTTQPCSKKNYPRTPPLHIPSGSEPFLHPELEAQVRTRHRFLTGRQELRSRTTRNRVPPSSTTTPVKQPSASRCLARGSKQSLHPASHWGPTDICTQIFALWVTSSTSGGRSCTTTYSPSSSNLCTPSSYLICGT